MWTIILALCIFAIIFAGYILSRTNKCPICGHPMEPYDDKRDVCVNPDCQ